MDRRSRSPSEVIQGEQITAEKVVTRVHVARAGASPSRAWRPAREVVRLAGFRRAALRARAALGRALGSLLARAARTSEERRPGRVAPPHLPPPGRTSPSTPSTSTPGSRPAAWPGRHTADTSSGTRCSSSRSSTCAFRTSPGACSAIATGGSTPRAGSPGRRDTTAPLYPWQSGSNGAELTPDDPPQPALRSLDPGQLPSPATHQCRDRLRRLALSPGDQRRRVPGLPRRGDVHRDRPFLGEHRHLRPNPRSVRDPRGGRPRRVPRRAIPVPSGPGIDNNAYTNAMAAWVLWRAGDVLARAPRAAPRRAVAHARVGARGARAVGRDQPQAVSPFPRRRDHQPVRGLRGPGGARLGGLSREVREHPAARPDPGGRGGQPQPVQGLEAGGRADALLPAVRRRAADALRPAGLPVRVRHDPEEHRVLPGAHLTRLHPEQGGPRVGVGARRSRAIMEALLRGARERPARRPGRHDRGRACTSVRWPEPWTWSSVPTRG